MSSAVPSPPVLDAPEEMPASSSPNLGELNAQILNAARYLPTQGPISVFVPHNTLHAFEECPFPDAVVRANNLFRSQPYMLEDQYRAALEKERILKRDLHEVLIEQLGDEADVLVGQLGTRYELRMAMLCHPLPHGTPAESRWFIDEAEALYRFYDGVDAQHRQRMVEQTRHWVLREILANSQAGHTPKTPIELRLPDAFDTKNVENWSESTWEACTLHLLWNVCWQGVQLPPDSDRPSRKPLRQRALTYRGFQKQIDTLVNAELIRFCAVFIDQGFAAWQLPHRDQGFFQAFGDLYGARKAVEPWLHAVFDEIRAIKRTGMEPLACIERSLKELDVDESERESFLIDTLLALPGFAGMLWQLETNGEWTVRPAPPGTLVGYLALRLMLDRAVFNYLTKQRHQRLPFAEQSLTADQRALLVFKLAQLRGWTPQELAGLGIRDWQQLWREIHAFDELERRRVYHVAYERRYRCQTLDAISIFSELHPERTSDCVRAEYQVVCCIDDREESLRRHLEEVDPGAETFGFAGFFGVAMYYRGATEAHYRPSCPVNVKPVHFVREAPVFTLRRSSERQEAARRRVGHVSHRIHLHTRTAAGGLITGILGSITSLPLVMQILFPRASARLGRMFKRVIDPPMTELCLDRQAEKPGPEPEQLGYSLEEMTNIVKSTLLAMGLGQDFAPVVLIMGHGSSSLNNPHEVAFGCGACGGGRGGPNARAFAQMANDLRVRDILAEDGFIIPRNVYFLGAYHNTCDDAIEYYDLDRMPASKRRLFARVSNALEEARVRDAMERCRRFESASFSLTPLGALHHVERRSQDLSQVRPEYCHATTSLCIVGRRSRTRGLFLDRRAFLTSYDPTSDGDGSVLSRLLGAVIPLCAGISLEYYFSSVDTVRYGCGSKLPHNLTGLVGVMEGAESDLRTGLPEQMIEIHEPMRILFVIETHPSVLLEIMDNNPVVSRLVRNGWVHLATLDPNSERLQYFSDGEFFPYRPESTELPVVNESREWYRGWRGHLGYCAIKSPSSRQYSNLRKGARFEPYPNS